MWPPARGAGAERARAAAAAAVAVASGSRIPVSGGWAGWADRRRLGWVPRRAVFALLKLDDSCLGGRQRQGAVAPALGLRDCACVGDAEGADP